MGEKTKPLSSCIETFLPSNLGPETEIMKQKESWQLAAKLNSPFPLCNGPAPVTYQGE